MLPSLIAALAACTPCALFGTLFPQPANASQPIQVIVSPDGSGDFQTIQQAIDHAPQERDGRLVIAIRAGVYRERVVVPLDRPRVTFLGLGKDPSSTVITYNMSAAAAGGTFLSSTVDVEGAEFEASNVTIENSYGPGSQAVALSIHSDRAVLRHCRLIGWQDTLYAASGRQYYEDCYIAGAVDFIFGNAQAVFEDCEIHSAGAGYITAQSRTTSDGTGGFVLNHCKLTAVEAGKGVYLGRPWRPYARVVFLSTVMGSHIDPAGWREWHPGETHSLDTAFYAEYDSSGPGGLLVRREPHTRFLSSLEAKQFETKYFLSSTDGWDPTRDH
jgi:pectin methylesterase-like acyl-CoA thioesterase